MLLQDWQNRQKMEILRRSSIFNIARNINFQVKLRNLLKYSIKLDWNNSKQIKVILILLPDRAKTTIVIERYKKNDSGKVTKGEKRSDL